jgi:hypothetical protein
MQPAVSPSDDPTAPFNAPHPLGVPNPSTIDQDRGARDWLKTMTVPESRPSTGGTTTPSTNLRPVPGGKSKNSNSDITGIPEDKAKSKPLGDVTPTPPERKLDPPKGFRAAPTGGTPTRPSTSVRLSPADRSNNSNSDITGPGVGRPGGIRTGVPTGRPNPSAPTPETRPSTGGIPTRPSTNSNSDITGPGLGRPGGIRTGVPTGRPNPSAPTPETRPSTGGISTRPSTNSNSDITGPGLGRPDGIRTDGVPTGRPNPSGPAGGIAIDVAPVGKSEDLSDLKKKVLDLSEPKF